MMTALCFSGCASSRKVQESRVERSVEYKTDTLVREIRTVQMQPIPMEQARLELTKDSLLNLPVGAEYRKQQGRASATVRNEGGQIVVYATCDSLQALVDYYERTLQQKEADCQHLQNNVQTEKERRSNPVRTALIAFIVGVATGIVLTILIRRKI